MEPSPPLPPPAETLEEAVQELKQELKVCARICDSLALESLTYNDETMQDICCIINAIVVLLLPFPTFFNPDRCKLSSQ